MAQPAYPDSEKTVRGIANTGAVRKNNNREVRMTQSINTDNISSGIASSSVIRKSDHREKVSDRLSKKQILDQNTFAETQLAFENETGRQVAIKTMSKSKLEALDYLVRKRRGIQIMSSIRHPHITQIYQIFESRRKLILVMENVTGVDLYDYVSARGGLEENETRRIFRQIASAIYYCHAHTICHRNIKLENILLDERGNVKMVDFGCSNLFDDRLFLTTFCGTPFYSSPEIVNETPYRGPEVDCWSLGVLLYTLIYGVMPFYDQSFHALAKKITAGEYTEPELRSLASPFIKKMLTVSPENRATIETICEHPWMNIGYTTSCLHLAEQLVIDCSFNLKTLTYKEPENPKFELDPDSIHQEAEAIDEQLDNAESDDDINWYQSKLRSARKMLHRMCACLREPQLRWYSPVNPTDIQTPTMSASGRPQLHSDENPTDIRTSTVSASSRSQSHSDENPTDIRSSTMLASSIELKTYDEERFVEPTLVETTTV